MSIARSNSSILNTRLKKLETNHVKACRYEALVADCGQNAGT